MDDLPLAIRRNPLINRAKRTTSVVYRVIDGKSVCTPVKPGSSDLTHSIVLEGIEEGEEVVVGPYKVLEKIKHDELVKRERDEETEPEAESKAPDEKEQEEAEGQGEGVEEESVDEDGVEQEPEAARTPA
ncbi:MAG: hypothetical protein ACYSU7_07860 [Planctomycetota bacterium]